MQFELRCSQEALVLLVKVKQVPAENLHWLCNALSFENTLGHSTDLVTVTTIQTWALITAADQRITQETEGTTVKAKYFKGRREIGNILSYATLPSLL